MTIRHHLRGRLGRLTALIFLVVLVSQPVSAVVSHDLISLGRGRRNALLKHVSPVRNPSANEAPSPPGGTGCRSYGLSVLLASPDNSDACIAGALAALDNSRANEGLAPLSFDIAAFAAMPTYEQIFAITDLERLSRGLVPAAYLTTQLDTASQLGANTSSDPQLPSTLAGGAVPVWSTSNWQGGDSNVLWADDTWLYDDGFGSSNADCTGPGSPGCWVHRHNTLLPNPPAGCYLAMGAASRGLSFADMLVQGCGPPPPDQVLSWSSTLSSLAGSGQFAIATRALVAPDSFSADYSSWLQAENATGPVSWSLNSGSLPPGFSLTPDGHLTGPASALTGDTSFSVRLTERGANSQSAAQSLTLAFNPTGIPAAPTNVVASAANGAATVSWNQSATRAGPAIQSYAVTELYAGPHGCSTAAPSQTSCVVHGLTNGRPYVFSVTATNSVGTSGASVASNVVSPSASPPAPVAPPSISIASTRLRLRTGTRTIPVTLRCFGAACSGTLRLSAIMLLSRLRASSWSKTVASTASVLLATARYRMTAGGHARVELTLTPAGRTRLAELTSAAPLHARLTISVVRGRALRSPVEVS